MIVKMTGKVDGQKIIFEKDGSGLWSAAIPKDKDGEYVVSITAYDQAGNVAHKSTVLFDIDSYNVEIKVIPAQYTYFYDVDQYGRVIELNYRTDYMYRHISSELVRGCYNADA